MRTSETAATKPKRTRRAGRSHMLKAFVMLLMPLMVAAIVACDTNSATPTPAATPTTAAYANSPEGKPPGLGAPVPDPKEVIEVKPVGQVPDFISQAGPGSRDKIAKQYQGAVDNYDAYAHVPCYCGCAVYTTAHKSLAECFIKEKKSDGTIAFTDHSLTCDLCQGAAQMTLDGIAANKPLKDVRAEIFKKLSYTGIWTDTPPVQ